MSEETDAVIDLKIYFFLLLLMVFKQYVVVITLLVLFSIFCIAFLIQKKYEDKKINGTKTK